MSTDPRSRTIARARFKRVASWRSSWIIVQLRLACLSYGRLHRWSATPCFVVDERIDGRVLAAKRASLVLAQLELAEAHVLALEEQIAADHRLADVQEVLDR